MHDVHCLQAPATAPGSASTTTSKNSLDARLRAQDPQPRRSKRLAHQHVELASSPKVPWQEDLGRKLAGCDGSPTENAAILEPEADHEGGDRVIAAYPTKQQMGTGDFSRKANHLEVTHVYHCIAAMCCMWLHSIKSLPSPAQLSPTLPCPALP